MSTKHQTQPQTEPVTSDGLRRLQLALEAQIVAAGAAGVSSWNGRTGAVTLVAGDVTTALGFTPLSSNSLTVVSKNATYTEATTTNEIVILASGTFTINLPTAVGNTAKFNVKLVAAGTVTIDPNGAQTIDGAATLDITVLNQTVTFVSNNANWFII